jgi:hypothetical protein
MPRWSLRKEEKNKSEINELERICLEEPVTDGEKQVTIPEELRKRLYCDVLSFLPLKKILDDGYTSDKRKDLAAEGRYREAAAVSMKDPRILTDIELQREVREYLEKTGFQINALLEENKHALVAIYTFGHKHVGKYVLAQTQETQVQEAQRKGNLDAVLYGSKTRK